MIRNGSCLSGPVWCPGAPPMRQMIPALDTRGTHVGATSHSVRSSRSSPFAQQRIFDRERHEHAYRFRITAARQQNQSTQPEGHATPPRVRLLHLRDRNRALHPVRERCGPSPRIPPASPRIESLRSARTDPIGRRFDETLRMDDFEHRKRRGTTDRRAAIARCQDSRALPGFMIGSRPITAESGKHAAERLRDGQ